MTATFTRIVRGAAPVLCSVEVVRVTATLRLTVRGRCARPADYYYGTAPLCTQHAQREALAQALLNNVEGTA